MKIWIFAEGKSEVHFATCLVRYNFPNVKIIQDLSAFIKEDSYNNYMCHIENCGSVDKIPHNINDNHHLIQRSKADYILVACDIEKNVNCPLERKKRIEDRLDEGVDKNKMKFVFSIPTIEEIYCFEKELTEKVLKVLLKERITNQEHISSNLDILNGPKSPKEKLKKYFESHGGNYRESIFAEKFFPQLQYKESKNKTVLRLVSIVEKIFKEEA